MKRDIGRTSLNDPLLKGALAVLISCTRTTRRPLPLTDVARALRLAVSRLGSFANVAGRLGISAKMLRQFSYVDRLNKNVKLLFERRHLDSVDAAAHLAMLPSEDQDVTARKLAARLIDSSDVRAIVQLRKTGAKDDIRDLLERVSQSKTTKRFVAEFVIRGRL